jgi:hypothetical protein
MYVGIPLQLRKGSMSPTGNDLEEKVEQIMRIYIAIDIYTRIYTELLLGPANFVSRAVSYGIKMNGNTVHRSSAINTRSRGIYI